MPWAKCFRASVVASILAGRVFALTATEWQFRQTVTVPAAGLVQLQPTDETFDGAGRDAQDLRILDPNGREVALLLDRPPRPAAQQRRPENEDLRFEDGATVLTITTGTDAPLESVRLDIPVPSFLRAAQVEVAGPSGAFETIERGVPLFRQWGAEQVEVDLGKRTAARVRITIAGSRSGPLPVRSSLLHLAEGAAPKLLPVGGHITRRDEFSGETVLTLTLDAKHVPLASLEVATPEPLFMRRVTVAVREVNGLVSGERVIGSGTIYRVALDGAPAKSRLDLALHHTPETRELLVHIHNGDSPPLGIESVRAMRQPLSLLFHASAAGDYQLLSGNPQATAPRYDLAAFTEELRRAPATTVVPGARSPMPNYQPRASLSGPPLPDIPLVGAPLDTADWRARKPVSITAPGVQELELDPGTLAGARSTFADLRLMRGNHQIPYVLEQPQLSRSLTLEAVPVPDPKRPNVSIWSLKLPHRGLPLRNVALSTSTPLFQRDVRIYERRPSPNGGTTAHPLGGGGWSRTPEPGVPETRLFELNDRLQTDTLYIETDNGDNPALSLTAVKAAYPVVRLIFKVDETAGHALAFNHPEVAAPRYDLSLVAAKLLLAPRHTATLGGGDPGNSESAGTRLLASLKGGAIFWSALALVVIVLLVVVARLLPKPVDKA